MYVDLRLKKKDAKIFRVKFLLIYIKHFCNITIWICQYGTCCAPLIFNTIKEKENPKICAENIRTLFVEEYEKSDTKSHISFAKIEIHTFIDTHIQEKKITWNINH